MAYSLALGFNGAENPEPLMYSLPNLERAYIRFWIRTVRQVNIIWLDFSGKRKLYAKCCKWGQFFDVDTFTNHSWTFEDSETGDELVGNKVKVFSIDYFDDTFGRLDVNITVPMYTLRERSLQVVRDSLRGPPPPSYPEPFLYSLPSQDRVYIRFWIRTKRQVNIIWLDFSGLRQFYAKSCRWGQFVDVNTFTNHAWIFEDSETGDQLVANKVKVFRINNYTPPRLDVSITLPMFTLRERSLQVVRDCLRGPQPPLQLLGLPNTIQQDLLKLFSKKIIYDL